MRRLSLVLTTLAVMAVAGCGDDSAPNDNGAATSPGGASTPASEKPTPTEVALLAQSIRTQAETTTDIGFMDGLIDPSQSAASRVVGPVLLIYARNAALIDAARDRWGDDGAMAASESLQAISIDLGNGLAEMFEADHFEEVRRDGGRAYVMANMADMQPLGDPIVFKDNQGDWLLLLCDGDEPWAESRIGMFASTMTESLKSAGDRASRLDDLTARVRAGEVDSVGDLKAEIERLDRTRG
jgi:hypothetical protein